MGMGHGAGFALVLEQEKIKEMNLGSYVNFIQALKEQNVTLEEYGRSTQSDDSIYDVNGEEIEIEDAEKLDGCFQWLQEEFKEKTGVSIEIRYHSSEDGDIYDEIDGVYFDLDFADVYQMTPQAQMLQEKTGFEMQFFVTFG